MTFHQQEIDTLLERLATYRQVLVYLLKQKAQSGLHTPIHVMFEIENARKEIAQLKDGIRHLGIQVDDQFDDVDRSAKPVDQDYNHVTYLNGPPQDNSPAAVLHGRP